MKRQNIILFILLIIAFGSIAQQRDTSYNKILLKYNSIQNDSSEIYNVYSAVINFIYKDENEGILIIVDSTIHLDTLDDYSEINFIKLDPLLKKRLDKSNPWYDYSYNGLADYIHHNPSVYDLLIEYNKINKYHQKIFNNFKTNFTINLISKKELDSIFAFDKNNGGFDNIKLKNFDKQYPKWLGIINISKIAFSQDKKDAVMYIQALHTAVCGFACLVFCTKHRSNWVVIKQIVLWGV